MSSSSAPTSASQTPSSTAASAPLPTPADLDTLILQRRWADLLGVAQRKELEEGGNVAKDTEAWYAIELYAAALAKELLTTKFIWKRIPKDIKKKSKDLNAIWKILHSLHVSEFATYYNDSAAYQSSLSLTQLQRLNAALREETQQRNILNIRRAYTTISVDEASILLGLNKSEVPNFLANQLRWQQTDASSPQFFNPTPITIPKQREISTKQIEELTKYVAHLESE